MANIKEAPTQGKADYREKLKTRKISYERTFKKENSSGFVKGTSSSLKPLMFASLQGYEGQPFLDDDVRISGII